MNEIFRNLYSMYKFQVKEMNKLIDSLELIVSDKATTTEKGQLLESLGREVLNILQYNVEEAVRLTGIEVDLLAENRISGEKIFVECKAHQNNLSADVFTKLIGNIFVKGVSSGWLFTSGPLSKDAKGFCEEWAQKPLEQRKMLNIYTADKLIQLLVNSGKIIDPKKLYKDNKYNFSEENILLITDYGRFWALKIMHVSAGVPYGVILYDAENGNLILDKETINSVMKLPSSVAELDVITSDTKVNNIALNEISEEINNISIVTGGDQWADYRPSRPKDFVGREDLFPEIFKFLGTVMEEDTNTRLLAIKAPSGWGKSSVLLKLVSKSKGKQYKTKYFLHAVDVRTAISNRYGEFSLLSSIHTAIEEGFIKKPINEVVITNTVTPLIGDGMTEVLKSLKEENKVLVLFFDQFEEIFSKQDLADLFKKIKELALAIDSARENIVLGFAWKTDGTTPTDHPAYYMWQSLSDRRREFQLSTFTPKEMQKALNIFSRELGETLNQNLKKYLIDHCQGYPWLLKKLCIHVYSLISTGIEQSEIVGKGLDIESLFERDLSELTGSEVACLKKIASESPADFFKVDQDFGHETLHSLLNKRLIIRKGHKLILYWDIFRDYVLHGSVPKIRITYIPQVNFNRYNDLLELLFTEKKMTIQSIADSLNIGVSASDNIVRDMVMFGNVSRQNEVITLLQETELESISKVYDFFYNHIVLKTIIDKYGEDFQIEAQDYERIFMTVYKDSQFSSNTLNSYIKKVKNWMVNLGIIKLERGYLINSSEYSSRNPNYMHLLNIQNGIRVNSRLHPFLGAAPAERVIELIEVIQSGEYNEVKLKKVGLRNAITVGKSLGLVYKHGDSIRLTTISENYRLDIAQRVKETETIKLIESYKVANGEYPESKVVGTQVAELLNKVWKENSKTRTGLSLLKWHKWAEEEIEKHLVKS